MENPPNISKLDVGDTPSYYWLMDVNAKAGYTYITVPGPGEIWIYYQPYQQLEACYVWHRPGGTTEIKPGETTVRVGDGDMIIYQLKDPVRDQIRLAFRLSI